ncbi:hypothetical protein RHGRI_027473 [Rhododendron griersonianum]|uniref:RING-type E3 ubiquitin transferase n=1 Tax=Rhododendron griersonianum TaxID=479676 RepID=A0AAV6J074_9ERIC|nr:hypothetical protein RHGRI_027473 [Rhododendron griersonianum]
MSIYFSLFFLLSLSTAQDDCTSTTSKCSDDGPPIRFPFRLKNQHPPHCGYPGFDLSCSPNNTTTVLDLPNSVKVIVTDIDYKSRLIHIKDLNGCFPQQLQNLKLSTTPFNFPYFMDDFGLLSCPPSTKMERLYWESGPTYQEKSYRVTCLGGDGRDVYFQDNYSSIDLKPELISCRKMYNVWSVPYEVFDQTADLQLQWLQPDCGKCETDGKFCRLMNNSTSDEILCFGNLNPPKKDSVHNFRIFSCLTEKPDFPNCGSCLNGNVHVMSGEMTIQGHPEFSYNRGK